jgi:RNA polymerase sigma factor (sigma-70 family)
MDDATLAFNRLRPRLQGIAYRMLGSMAEAEEVVQDAWLRWHDAAKDSLDSAEAWLVTVVTRLSIDRLRTAKVQREHYIGTWMPEPTMTDAPATPEQLLERADNVSVAFLAVLERLAPEARAAFLLREVFDADYDDIASTLGKTEAACRQLVHRAKSQVRRRARASAVSRETHERLLRAFADAAARGSLHGPEGADVGGRGDSSATAAARCRPSARSCAAASGWRSCIFGVAPPGAAVRMELADLNGEPGLLRFIDGQLESVQTFEIDGERIVRIHAQRNPDKLARIARLL